MNKKGVIPALAYLAIVLAGVLVIVTAVPTIKVTLIEVIRAFN